MTRHKRHWSPLDERYLLDTLEDARRACTQACGKVEIQGDLYNALHKVTQAIDEVCVATGASASTSGTSRTRRKEPGHSRSLAPAWFARWQD